MHTDLILRKPGAAVRSAKASWRLFAKVLLAAIGLAPLVCAQAQPGSWTRKADLPMAISTPAACGVDGILYVIGGHDRAFHQLATVYAYDPKTDQWTRKSDMPTPRRWLSVAVVDGIIYAIGGGGWQDPVLKVVEAYDPKTDAWSTRSPMPTGRFTFACCAVNGVIYAMGGGDNAMAGLSTVEAYDPRTDHWTTRTSMPVALGLMAADAIDGLIHVCHGNEVFTYDPGLNQWSTRKPFPTWTQGAMASGFEGTLYLFGGCNNDLSAAYNLATGFDPNSGTVSQWRHMPRTRAFGASVAMDGRIYLLGGADQEPVVNPKAIFWNVLDVFDPHGGVTPQITGLDRSAPDFLDLTWQGETGIRYAVQSAPDPVQGPWVRVPLKSGQGTLVATNSVVRGSVGLSPADSARFFRILDLD